MIKKIIDYCNNLIHEKRSPTQLALSFCVGSYVAFSPFLMFHTVMVVAAWWFFQLDFGVMMTVSCGINNPWTAIPIYTLDYCFGYWFVHKCMHITTLTYNPSWMYYINNFFEHTLGLAKPCLLSFLIGGNLLGIMVSIILYPIVKKIFSKLTSSTSGGVA